MGRLIILTGLLISVLMWGNLKNIYVIFSLYIAISFGLLGCLMRVEASSYNLICTNIRVPKYYF